MVEAEETAEAKELHALLLGSQADFRTGWHTNVPWPELTLKRAELSMIEGIQGKDYMKTCEFMGRSSIAFIESLIERCSKNRDVTMTGTAGSGKTMLLAMAVCNHYARGRQEGCRLVAIFDPPACTDPVSTVGTLQVVRRALLLAYADQEDKVDAISAMGKWTEIGAFLIRHRPVLVFDAYDVVHHLPDVQQEMDILLKHMSFLKCLTATNEGIKKVVDPVGFFSVFSDQEMDKDLIYYTGRLPLFVTLIARCVMAIVEDQQLQIALSDDQWEIVVMMFRGDDMIANLETSILYCQDVSRYAQFVCTGVANVKQYGDIDLQFVIRDGAGIYHPVSSYARDLYYQCLQSRKLLSESETVFCNTLSNALKDRLKNKSRIQWLVERVMMAALEDRISALWPAYFRDQSNFGMVHVVWTWQNTIWLGHINVGPYAAHRSSLEAFLKTPTTTWTTSPANEVSWKFVWFVHPEEMTNVPPTIQNFEGTDVPVDVIARSFMDVASYVASQRIASVLLEFVDRRWQPPAPSANAAAASAKVAAIALPAGVAVTPSVVIMCSCGQPTADMGLVTREESSVGLVMPLEQPREDENVFQSAVYLLF
ncbi:hypothetical protein SELMODRAFT_422201 [Selaginella moellendorffii]|uniref:Uncharacterized protein n=1 Tax=Selaginella moellendorffii TaxID=88036 RepID=D8SHP0_SELML|nr:hypothetical protein SELMODRAFT_422201 [Selaginella moellendorffii]